MILTSADGDVRIVRAFEAGVRVTEVRYLGMMHDFVMLNALAKAPQARSAIALASSNLRRAFNL